MEETKLRQLFKNSADAYLNTIDESVEQGMSEDSFIKAVAQAINYTRFCETSIADLQISDKITFKQHRSGIITDVYINELQVKDVNGNYKTIGKNDVIEKH
jgi:hypothetical protein